MTYQDVDDDVLAQRAVSESAAFGELYRRHNRRVYRYLLSRTENEDDAQDLTAQTFIAALERLADYRPQGKFSAWLVGIARHKATDHFRQRRKIVSLDAAESMAHPGPQPDEAASINLQLAQVSAALRTLSADRAEALSLRLYGELTAAEIAAIMGKTEAAVKMLVHRAWRDLRAALGAMRVEERTGS